MSTELVELRSFYAAPGLLLLAREAGEPVGCVGLRALDVSQGEVRRLFVRPAHRSGGLGRRLVDSVVAQAQQRGVTRLRLTTLPTMTAAQALYAAQGFLPVEPYGDGADGWGAVPRP